MAGSTVQVGLSAVFHVVAQQLRAFGAFRPYRMACKQDKAGIALGPWV
ncbi:hypothetical protein [Roseinatronobacter sp.]|nr:hypothetical protein [Rhodobaca sp.]